jgi:hypothetical protein
MERQELIKIIKDVDTLAEQKADIIHNALAESRRRKLTMTGLFLITLLSLLFVLVIQYKNNLNP